ncbi:phage integrase family protein [Roseovarius halotolerans]|uniref:Phage integrase family protein n=2 Tax=Roseovarius halotolerans TaxID=505353 RepID=A0A1X6Y7K0_9RHOB|nr:phage integrase family protein [Roseovarius halotolerans]SLN11321.1 Phage integrase family protein [Roseovarius halotolerans]
MAGLAKRGETWHLRMRVPRRYDPLWVGMKKPPKEIHRSLKTGDKKEAMARLAAVEAQILAELDARLAGVDLPGSRSHYEAIARLTTARGFGYRTAGELADGDLGDVLRRVEKVQEVEKEKARGKDRKDVKPAHMTETALALLGGVDRPRETLLEIAERMEEISPLDVRDKNQKQRRVWRDRWLRPAKKVKELLGRDPVLDEISRADAIDFRDALQDRILDGDMKGSSAQKDLQNLNRMWKLYHASLGYDVAEIPPSPFRGLGEGMSKLDDEGRKDEVPIDAVENIVHPGAMDDLHPELRDITLILIETGCRQSEVTDLPPHHIHLDDPIPHIEIRRATGEFARELKNKHSTRNVPLVGVALGAMRRHPEGFPKYRGTGTYSGEANRSLRAAGLLPDGVTIGGLRHSFETRLKNTGVDSDDRAELMGHSVKRARGREWYGDSMPLEKRLEYHQKIEIQPVKQLPAPD